VTVDELLALAHVLGVPVRELLPGVATSTPLAFAGLTDEQRVAAEANAAQAAPEIAATITGLLTEGQPIEPRWVAEAFYRLREALNALTIGEARGSAALPMEPLKGGDVVG